LDYVKNRLDFSKFKARNRKNDSSRLSRFYDKDNNYRIHAAV